MRKKCIRHVWDTGVTAAQVIAKNEAPLSAAQWNAQVIPVQTAVDGLLAGDWDGFTHWGPVIKCRGVIRSLLKLAKRQDFGFIDQLDVMCAVSTERYRDTGSTALRYDERAILQDMVMVFGNLLKEATAKQLHLATQHDCADRARVLGGNRKQKAAKK